MKHFAMIILCVSLLLLLGYPATAQAETEYPRFSAASGEKPKYDLIALVDHCIGFPTEDFCKNPLDLTKEIPAYATDRAISPIASLGGASWEDAIIQGTTAFIAKRAEEELLASFVDHLKNELCGDAKAKQYFPNTCMLTEKINTNMHQVPWGVFKSTIEKDLQAMPYRLVEYNVVPAINGNNVPPDVGQYFYAMIDIIFLLERGENPFNVMAGMKKYYQDFPLDWTNSPSAASLYLVGTLTEVIRPLIEKNEQSIAEKSLTWEIAARLVYEQMKADGKENLIPTIDEERRKKIVELRSIYMELAKIDKELRNVNNALSKRDDTQINNQMRAFSLYIQSATKIMQSYKTVMDVLGRQSGTETTYVNCVAKALGNLGDALNHVRSKEYNLVFVDVLALVENVNALRTDQSKDILPAWYYRYGPFLVEMATAKDAESVEKALENAAAPVGTWRAKRGCGAHMFSITSYFGAGGGGEWVKSFSDSNATPFYGLFMPVGVEYAVGLGDYSSFQLMGSVANLGTIADFRYHPDDEDTFEVDGEDAEVEEDPTYTFAQVFSPGVYGSFGIYKTPLVIGGGVSLAPRLRTIKYDAEGDFETAEEDEINVVRAHLFLAVDVTLFRLGGCNCRKK